MLTAFVLLSSPYGIDSSQDPAKHNRLRTSIYRHLHQRSASIPVQYHGRSILINQSISTLLNVFDEQQILISTKDEIPEQMILDLIGCMECDDQTFSSKLDQLRNETSRLARGAAPSPQFKNARDMTVDIENYDGLDKQRRQRNRDATGRTLYKLQIAAIYSIVCGFVITMAVIVVVKMI